MPWFTPSRFNVADPLSRERPDDEPCRTVHWWESSIESSGDPDVDIDGLFGLPALRSCTAAWLASFSV